MDKVIEVNVDSGTLFAAEERLSGLGLSVQEAVLRLMENAAKGQSVGCDTGAGTEIAEKTMSLSEARQKPGEVSAFISEPGRVVLMTCHGRGKHAMMSVETYRNLRARADYAYASGG